MKQHNYIVSHNYVKCHMRRYTKKTCVNIVLSYVINANFIYFSSHILHHSIIYDIIIKLSSYEKYFENKF